jgi:Na+/proline symporter
MPHGISGLLISAILAAAMSNLSAALNSLSSTTIVDFYARISPLSSEARRVSLSRLATIVWGFALFFLALLARHGGRVLETGLSIASVAYGCVLGVFLLGVLTKSANESGAIVGLLFGLSVNLYLWLGTSISFAWYVVFGSVATFIVGYGASKGLSRGMETPSSAHALEKQHG